MKTISDIRYRNKKWLEKKYIKEKLTTYQIAYICNCSKDTILNWLKKFNIPRRKTGVTHWTEEQKELRRVWNKKHLEIIGRKGKKHTKKTKKKMSLNRRGCNNGNWKGGITQIIKGIRRSPQYYQFRKKILERDNYTCQEYGRKNNLNVHHKKPISEFPKLIYEIDNGITYCEKCHKKKDGRDAKNIINKN